MRRALATLVAAFLAWLGLVASSATGAAPPPSAEVAHAYDSQHHAVCLTYRGSERGPPATDDGCTTYDPSGFGHVARPTGTTAGPAPRRDVELRAFRRWRVAANGGFTAPRIFTNRHGLLTNGKYSLDSPGMAPHISGATTTGKSRFLHRVNSDKAVLDAAAYADEAGLWVGNKAKVFIEDGPVGVIARTGELTSWIIVYRTRTGMVHGAPGSAP